MGALVSRLLLLFSLAWIIGLTRPLLEIMGRGISGRDLILVGVVATRCNRSRQWNIRQ